MTIEPAVTYEDRARWLSPEIRERIEVSAPCLASFNLEHLWDHVSLHVWPWYAENLWRCVYCTFESRTDPRPVDSWARRRQNHVVTAGEILREFP